MPRVTDEYRETQRQRFLSAVRRCVAERGVAATSMDDIRLAAGASAGAMYRYFGSKDELVRAAVADSMATVESLLEEVAESGDSAGPAALLRTYLTRLEGLAARNPDVDLFKVAVQGWAFAQQDRGAAEVLAASHARQQEVLARAARAWSRSPARQQAIAATIGAAVTGYVAQRALLGSVDVHRLTTGLDALLRSKPR